MPAIPREGERHGKSSVADERLHRRAGMRLAPTSPRGLWVMALSASLVLVAMLATAIPFRYAAAVPEGAGLHSPSIGEGAPPLSS